jgi:hypothetical protein
VTRKPAARKGSKFWTPERRRYWRDFDAALPVVGEAGAFLYAATGKLIRKAKARKVKR